MRLEFVVLASTHRAKRGPIAETRHVFFVRLRYLRSFVVNSVNSVIS